MVAGGMESMTNAPYLLPKMRGGARMGTCQVIDHMFLDGLEDAYDKGRLMGTFAEDCAEASSSPARRRTPMRSLAVGGAGGAGQRRLRGRDRAGHGEGRKGETVTEAEDEQPGNARPDKIPQLKPAFRKDGTVTRPIPRRSRTGRRRWCCLGAMRRGAGSDVRARILGHASHAQAPGLFTTAPVPAARKLLDRIGWSIDGCRPVGGQRGLRRGADGLHAEMGLPRDIW
jgi:acetyl-CoA C-acetyltransferase